MLTDDEGNIQIDRAADEWSALSWEDDNGDLIDLSARILCFKVHGRPALTYLLPLDEDDPTVRYLEFGQEFAAALGSKSREYWLEEHHADGKVSVLKRATITAVGSVS
jgi:hypothetical protein